MAVFGKQTNGASLTAASSDAVVVSTATPSSSGVATSLTARLLISAGAQPVRGVIYSNNAGAPGTLLATTDEVTVSNTAEAEVTASFSGANKVSLVSGTPYWVGVHWKYTAGQVISISRDGTAAGRREDYDTYADGSPATYTVDNTLSGPIDAYVTYAEPITITGSGFTNTNSFGTGTVTVEAIPATPAVVTADTLTIRSVEDNLVIREAPSDSLVIRSSTDSLTIRSVEDSLTIR